MVLAVVEDQVAALVEVRLWPGDVSPQIEALEPGGFAACREFGHHLHGVEWSGVRCASIRGRKVVVADSEHAVVGGHRHIITHEVEE